jgi:hypothetical protein
MKIPEREQTILISTKINEQLYHDVKQKCKDNNITIRSAIEYGLERFLEYRTEKEKKQIKDGLYGGGCVKCKCGSYMMRTYLGAKCNVCNTHIDLV